jgi:hypothetical protein
MIRIHNPNKRSAADPRLRTRGHWDGPCIINTLNNYTITQQTLNTTWLRESLASAVAEVSADGT